MRHDLQSLLKYDDSSLFKALGLFESQDEFSMAVEKACKYGSFEVMHTFRIFNLNMN